MAPPPARSELIERYQTCLRLNDGRLLLEGVCARSGVVTHNNRVYPAGPLERAARAFQRGAVQRGLALGELDHPSYASSLYRRVSLANASHAVLRLNWRKTRNGDGEGELVALIEVLPTPSGLLLFALAARGVPIAASQRCWAEVEWRRVDDDDQQIGFVCGRTLELLAVDVVPDPANAGAWLSPVARRVGGGGGGGFGWGCWPGVNLPAIASVDPSAVALAHLGTGAVSPTLAAEQGRALPTAAAVVERLCAAAEGEGSEGELCVGPLQLNSHYADACLEETPELRSLVAARVEGPDASGKASSRSLPAHWRRFAERALRCEARERARGQQVEEEDSDEASTPMGCLPCLPGSQRRVRRQQRGRRRAGSAAAASVAPLRSPLVEGDGRDGEEEALATTTIAAEVDAVLWSREDKARDVRRRVLRRWLA